MSMDTLAKQSIIIGAFSIALCLILILIEVQDLRNILNSDYISDEARSDLIQSDIILLIEYTSMALVCILLIIGAVKRWWILLVPWLIVALAGVTFMAYIGTNFLILVPWEDLTIFIPTLGFSGLITLILYPVCALFCDIYLENAKRKKSQAVNNEKMGCDRGVMEHKVIV
ncbi:uncharacterized protein LOC142239180 [Haematobia irritans]|uniref:uncharacterized protein LOC142239180 n=1 Tax=Haematobia irritans TaxID=7368 RepID=UPI003F50B663